MNLPIVKTVAALRQNVSAWRADNQTVALVPTMGALHKGHLSLVRIAKENASRVVASVYVNPAQFAPSEDFATYPRQLKRDAELLALAGCDLLYAPDTSVMYPQGFATSVSVSGITERFEGALRPMHFAGVATVVTKLFTQAMPDAAVFGEKDYQQLQLIRRLTRDLDLPVKIIPGPIVREADGLAMSSRNAYLSAEERRTAGRLNVILGETVESLRQGGVVAETLEKARQRLAEKGIPHIDYLELVHSETLEPVDPQAPGPKGRLLAAVRVGPVRLLDNMEV